MYQQMFVKPLTCSQDYAQDTGTIKVQLKRRLQYKSSALSLNVRPNNVMPAAAWLVNTSDLYRDQGVTFDQDW